MNVLLVYATYSNSTYSAAEIASTELKDAGHTVEIVLARETKPEQLQAADLVILASPSWDYFGDQGQPHEDYLVFNKTMADTTFPDKKFAILGLGDSTYTYFCGAVEHLQATVEKLQGKLIVESLKIDQYYINEVTATQQIKEWARNVSSTLQQS
jgi:flavodoxin I